MVPDPWSFSFQCGCPFGPVKLAHHSDWVRFLFPWNIWDNLTLDSGRLFWFWFSLDSDHLFCLLVGSNRKTICDDVLRWKLPTWEKMAHLLLFASEVRWYRRKEISRNWPHTIKPKEVLVETHQILWGCPWIRQAEGAVPLWNKSNPTQPIAAGDRVLSINGTSGDPKVSWWWIPGVPLREFLFIARGVEYWSKLYPKMESRKFWRVKFYHLLRNQSIISHKWRHNIHRQISKPSILVNFLPVKTESNSWSLFIGYGWFQVATRWQRHGCVELLKLGFQFRLVQH